MLPRNRREKDLMVQVEHKWVYKDILKLTPSTVSGKLIKKKKKTNLKNVSSMKCFHKPAVSSPKMQLTSTPLNERPYCGHPESLKYQSCQLNTIPLWPRSKVLLGNSFWVRKERPLISDSLFAKQRPDITQSSYRDGQKKLPPLSYPYHIPYHKTLPL